MGEADNAKEGCEYNFKMHDYRINWQDTRCCCPIELTHFSNLYLDNLEHVTVDLSQSSDYRMASILNIGRKPVRKELPGKEDCLDLGK